MVQHKVLLNTIDKVKTFSNIVPKFDCDMDLATGRYIVDAKSVMGVFSLNLCDPLTFTIHSDHPNEVLEAVKEYLVD